MGQIFACPAAVIISYLIVQTVGTEKRKNIRKRFQIFYGLGLTGLIFIKTSQMTDF